MTQPNLGGQTAVVTGANSGVGRSATELIAGAGARVIMVCRSRERGEEARDALLRSQADAKLELEIADLVDLTQVRGLGERLAARLESVDILVNNAGVWRQRLETSPDGFEVTFATNHLAHFLLTDLLLERLLAGRGRVVNVSSEAHRRGDFRRADIEAVARGGAWKNGIQAYGDSKLANVLFTRGLVARTGPRGLTANAIHPGVLSTRIWNQNSGPISVMMRAMKWIMSKPDVGGRAVMHQVAAADLDQVTQVTGRYFKVEREVEPSAQALDDSLVDELWERSSGWVGRDPA